VSHEDSLPYLFPEAYLRAVNPLGVKDMSNVSGSIGLHALPPLFRVIFEIEIIR
jgi:hypothetical protein